MAFRLRPGLAKPLIAVIATFTVALAAFLLLSRASAPHGTPFGSTGDGGASLAAARTTDQRIAALQTALRANPDNATGQASLGLAYLQKVRESGDVSYYPKAEAVFRTAIARDARTMPALVGMGQLALARHDFRGGLGWARRAETTAPESAAFFPVLVDALVELGRYDAARAALQRALDLKPTLAIYARASYFQELSGDLDGAVASMRLAISAGGDAPENVAYVQTLLGNLEWLRGRAGVAREAYRLALARTPSYAPALAGLARVDAARGHESAAIRSLRGVVARLPLPEYVIALGETEMAAGRTADARADLALVDAERRILAANGVNTDVDLAVFEANHGDAAKAVVLARRAWANGPSVRSADALGWSLTRAGRADAGLPWARRALRLGSRDPLYLYHAGIAARDTGRRGEARALLRRALSANPRFSPLEAPRARRALQAIS